MEASRSESRATLSSGSWDLGSDVDPDAKMTVREAGNKVVQALINGRDEASVPAGFDPDHADGDTGNAYESVASDGSITTSECGSAYNGKPFSRTFTAEQAAQLQFIHY